MPKSKLFFIWFLLFLISGNVTAQELHTENVIDTLLVNFDNTYIISSIPIVPQSESIRIRERLLVKAEYFINYSTGIFTLSDTLSYSIRDTLIVSYQRLKIGLQREYKRRTLITEYDSDLGDTISTVQNESNPFSASSIFGSDIQRSGMIARGFRVGTNNDLSLQSGLRLQLSGHLTDDIEVVAALTDENTPIQPEGNTERLEELDKVFIQIKHPIATGTFGDYDLNKRHGEFGIINRKLQGLMGEFQYDNYGGFVAIASSRGKFTSNTLQGSDGVQGPYRLFGKNNEKNIIIIAGSEKVFLDGEEMKRGENNDYVIDYSNASITFTVNRLITSASRIRIDFEYSDRFFERTLFGAGANASFFDNKLSISFQYLNEGDNKDAPIDFSLSDQDKLILQAAGDERNMAVRSGVTIAQPDSNGIIYGQYEKKDTLIDNEDFVYYTYNPGAPTALYNVSYTYVGEGQGNYKRVNIGQFAFTGIGNGDYLPVVYLPMPESRSFANLLISTTPYENISFKLEFAASTFDQNQLSDNDDNDNTGMAGNILFTLKPISFSIGSIDLGKIGFSYKERYTEKEFTALDRFNAVEFERDYNTGSSNNNLDESLREMSLSYLPNKNIRLSSLLGMMRKGSDFTSTRSNSNLFIQYPEKGEFDYSLDFVNTKNGRLSGYWLKQKANAQYILDFVRTGVRFFHEEKEDSYNDSDSLFSNSHRYIEGAPFISIKDLYGFSFKFGYSWREERSPINGLMKLESTATGKEFDIAYKGIREFSSTLRVVFRDKTYSEEFRANGFRNNETVLIRSRSNINLWQRAILGDIFYEVATEKTARLERVFLKVETGRGNYIYKGDLNNNGVADENEFELTLYDGEYILLTVPSDELFPVIDLKSGFRLKTDFERIFRGKSFWEQILSAFSTETNLRIEENSSQEDLAKIYLLDFGSFLNEEHTLHGSQYIQQDIHLFENKRDFSTRFRFNQRKSLTQYSGGTERAYKREQSVRVRFGMLKDVSFQTEFTHETDNLYAPPQSNRNRAIESNSLSFSLSYWFERFLEVSFSIKIGDKKDSFPEIPTEISSNAQTLNVNYTIGTSGRLRIELERFEILGNTSNNYLPFELTEGKSIGKNYLWRAHFDQKLSSNFQITGSYDGRFYGKGRVINTARAEARAYF